MMLVRSFDARLLRAHRQGKISFYMQSLGEEAIACAQQRALRPGDMHFPTYRQQGLLISAGYPIVEMMNQVLSNEHDPLKGRQLPVMYSSKAHGFFSISGNLATQYIQAVGWAMASAMRGGTAIASAWIGEGSTAESDFHAALRVRVDLPGAGHPEHRQQPLGDLDAGGLRPRARRRRSPTAATASASRRCASTATTTSPCYAASQWAAERARTNLGPTLIEWVTLRRGAHSTSDDPSVYRPDGRGRERSRSATRSIACASTSSRIGRVGRRRATTTLRREVDAEVEAAFAEADSHGSVKSGAIPSPRTMFDDVFDEMPRHLREQREQVG